MEHSKLVGTYVDPSAGKVTFRTFAEDWRQIQLHRRGTATSVEQQLRLHVYPHIGHRPINAIRPSELEAMVHHLVASLAHSTVEVVFGRVVAVFRAAVRDRLIAASPCPGVRVPQGKPASMLPVMTTEDVLAMAGAVPDRYSALVVFGAATGLRPGELFGLTKDRVHFLARRVVVDQQLARTGHGVGLAPLKTRSSYRNVPLAQVASDALAAHLARWSAHPELGLVFCNDWGKPIQQHPFSAMWTTARRKAGVPEWAKPHDLRHYFASTLIRSGASVKVIQARLGHASAKTTLDVYGHLFPDEEDRTRAAIDAELANLASPPRPGSLSKCKTAVQRG
jgi:integrase